jgi:ATPase, PilT family
VENKYLLDLEVIDIEKLKELLLSLDVEGKIIIHTAYFKNLSNIEEIRGISASLLRLSEIAQDYPKISIELTSYLPKNLYYEDFNVNKAHFLITLAIELGAQIVTSDPLLREMCYASRIKCLFIEPSKKIPTFTKYFKDDVMSLHLKEGTYAFVKRGKPGNWRLEKVSDKVLTRSELENIAREIYEIAKSSGDPSIKEIERKSSLIAQFEHYRIVLTRPPLSDGIEITIVKPVRMLKLEDYNLSPKLLERLEKQAEGILIAGAPGMGKTTFAQALAEFYFRKNKIIKTLESPRDMQLPPEITQLSKTHGTSEELHDVLLLSRPDYTIFDEMRDTKDFELYTDLRLAGVGMVGVIHSTSAIDAIQRFINRVELGMIPSIIDTVIFIKNGSIDKVYTLETAVKIPAGLTEADLTRPVVLVKDFETGEVEYEIYVFGERTFVVPIKSTSRDEGVKNSIINVIKKYIPAVEMEIEKREEGFLVKVPFSYYSRVQHKARKKLERISRKYNVKVELIPV